MRSRRSVKTLLRPDVKTHKMGYETPAPAGMEFDIDGNPMPW
jgi:hypothetical protein